MDVRARALRHLQRRRREPPRRRRGPHRRLRRRGRSPGRDRRSGPRSRRRDRNLDGVRERQRVPFRRRHDRGFSLGGRLQIEQHQLAGTITGTAATSEGQASLSFAGKALEIATSASIWSSLAVPAPAAPAAAPAAATSTTGTTATTTTGTYKVSAAVLSYLTKTLGLPLGTSTTLSGSLSNGVLTVSTGAPSKVTVKLPTGDAALALKTTKLAITEKTNSLSLTSTGTAAGGESASLTVTIAKANTSTATSYKATLKVGISVFGKALSLSATSTTASFSPKGTIPAGTALTTDSTFQTGTVTLHSGSLAVSGTAVVAAGTPASISLTVTGSISNIASWTLRATGSETNWQPISGLVISPAFSGTFTLKAGTVGMKLTATAPTGATWVPGANASMALSGFTLTNAAPGSDVNCNGLVAGDSWLEVAGNLTYNILGASALTLPANACVALGSTFYTTTTAATGSLGFGSPLFTIGGVQLVVSGDTASNAFSVTGTATATYASTPALTLALDFSSTGAFIGAVSLPDLSQFGVAGLNGQGVVWVSSEDVPVFVPPPGLPQVAAFHLRKGLSISFTYNVDPNEVASLRQWGIPVPSQVQAVAALSAEGFTVELDLSFGNGNAGLLLFTSDPKDTSDPNALYLYLNGISIAITLGAETSLEFAGVATLDVPAITGDSDSTAQSVMVTLTGSVNLDSGSIQVGVALSGSCGGQACPWQNAFGIPNLTISQFAASVGVTFDSGVPTPTFGFSLDGVILPPAISGPIGLQADASITIDVNFDLAAPIVNLQLAPGASGGPALLPLTITQDQAIENDLVIDYAGVWLAPLGGTLSNGTTVTPGIAIDFQAVIAGVTVTFDDQVSPSTLTVSGTMSVSPFMLGPVSFGQDGQDPVYIYTSISPQGFVFQFESSFASDGFTFYADVDLTAIATFAGASVNLWVDAGLPSFISIGGALAGSISLDSSGNLQLSASGTGSIIVVGQNLGTVSFYYSFAAGGLWQPLTASADQVAAAFQYAYGWADTNVTYWLNQLEYSADSIAGALEYAFSLSPTQIADDLIAYVTSSSSVVSEALQYAGFNYDQIASVLENVWGYTAQDVQNTLQAIGADAWSVLNALESVFTSGWDGAYNLSVTPNWNGIPGLPLLMDVSGGSQSSGADVIDYWADTGSNQNWYFVDEGNGYAEIVNQNSGQCLSLPGYDLNEGDYIVQEPCVGAAYELWSMNVVQQNLLGPTVVITNAYSGYVVDADGASWSPANLDQYASNGGWNQEWTITPGL